MFSCLQAIVAIYYHQYSTIAYDFDGFLQDAALGTQLWNYKCVQ
jgi:hypothetical protein